MPHTPLRKSYDAVIIGAGPAGLNAGLHLTNADPNLSVLLLDKAKPWEKPIPCAEGVGSLGFEEALEVDPAWIRQVISKAVFYSPDGSSVTYGDKSKGYIIDRAKMQYDITCRLQKRGVQTQLGSRVTFISPIEGNTRQVTIDDETTVEAGVVIDASGPVSLLGRNEPICWKPYDLEPAYFAVVENVNIDNEAIQIHTGHTIAPGGYAWVFPRSHSAANIGIVVGSRCVKKKNLKELLEAFLSRYYPHGEIRSRFAGALPCGYQRRKIALPGLIKCGDAANSINPISRAGIVEALMSGGLAGDHAFRMLTSEPRRHPGICSKYEKAWYAKRGARHLKLARVKNSMFKVPDEDYNRAAQALQSLNPEEITMSRIFRASLGRFPRLVWALRHLM
ncbi:MAG: geranylgeranyl reductase family protein [Chitinispirillaceae bacterium]